MTTEAINRMTNEIDFLRMGIDFLKADGIPDMAKLNIGLLEAMLEGSEKVLEAYNEGTPFIASYYAYAPEIYTAMDIPWYSPGAAMTNFVTSGEQVANEVAELDFPPDVCTAIRISANLIDRGRCLPPTASVDMITPCDGMLILHQILAAREDWQGVPQFAPDPPYMEDDRSLDYYTQEFRRMVKFVEEHTGKKLDIDRLREVIEESNKQYQLWAEYNELRRAVPCPHGWEMGSQIYAMVQTLWPGDPRCTTWLQEVIASSEQRVREKIGAAEPERIRLFWYDIRPMWIEEFATWLEQEWGAVIVMDMFTYNPYTLIDTSTEDSMFRGLAKRGLYDVPMVRQERGGPDTLRQDITGIVKDYKVDCVVWPAHMGHKAMAGTVGIGREICRDLGVPFLYLGMDLFDNRYTTADEVKDKMSKFFVAMGLG